MGLKRAIQTFFHEPEPTSSLDAVEPGLNILEGTVEIDDPLRSPVRGQHCAAFHYEGFLVMTSGRAPAIHRLKKESGYAPFRLRLDDGEVAVVPSSEKALTQQDHLALGQQYGPEYQAVEDIIPGGARVQVRGKVRREGDRLVMRMKTVVVLEGSKVAAAGLSRKERRRQQRKKDRG